MRATRRFQRAGFTPLQMVFVLGILLFLIGLLVPAVQKVRQAAARTQSISHLKQMGVGMHAYHDVNKSFPPAVDDIGPAHFYILPYIDQGPLYNAADGASWKNQTYGAVIDIYRDPRDHTTATPVYKNWLATTNYAVNWMVCKEGRTRFTDITDGSSNTLLFAQRYQMCNGAPTAWGYPSIHTWAPMFAYYSAGKFQIHPTQEQCDPRLTQTIGHVMLAGFGDGTVRHISNDVRPATWYYLCAPSDGNAIADADFN